MLYPKLVIALPLVRAAVLPRQDFDFDGIDVKINADTITVDANIADAVVSGGPASSVTVGNSDGDTKDLDSVNKGNCHRCEEGNGQGNGQGPITTVLDTTIFVPGQGQVTTVLDTTIFFTSYTTIYDSAPSFTTHTTTTSPSPSAPSAPVKIANEAITSAALPSTSVVQSTTSVVQPTTSTTTKSTTGGGGGSGDDGSGSCPPDTSGQHLSQGINGNPDKSMIDSTNEIRKLYKSKANCLSWSDSLAAGAQKCADQTSESQCTRGNSGVVSDPIYDTKITDMAHYEGKLATTLFEVSMYYMLCQSPGDSQLQNTCSCQHWTDSTFQTCDSVKTGEDGCVGAACTGHHDMIVDAGNTQWFMGVGINNAKSWMSCSFAATN